MEKPSYPKAIASAFVVGGAFGVVGQCLVLLYGMTPIYESGFLSVAVLLTMGVIGGVLFVAGVYPKLEEVGGAGAQLMFSGLVAALAGMFCGVRKQTGSAGKAIKAMFVELMVKVIAVATLICMVIALVIHFTGFGAIYTASYAPAGIVVENVGAPWGDAQGSPLGTAVGIEPISLLWAFLIIGAICALAQWFLMAAKAPFPLFMTALIVIGGLLTPFGVMKQLVSAAGGGAMIVVLDYGEGVVSTFATLLHGGVPGPMPFLALLAVLVILFILGLVCGIAREAIESRNGSARSEASE